MKKVTFLTIVMAFITMSFNTPINLAEKTLKVDVSKSTIHWKGYKPTGSHSGTITLESGALKMDNGTIKGGYFIANMLTIKDAGGSAKLERHLKSDDFFDVAAFPTSKFEITDSETIEGKMMITGNMTIKGITKQLIFPVTVTETAETVTLTSETFQVNKSEYNIKYKSKSFFNNLKEKFIENIFDLQVVIVAVK